jgi:hypothetical protein
MKGNKREDVSFDMDVSEEIGDELKKKIALYYHPLVDTSVLTC